MFGAYAPGQGYFGQGPLTVPPSNPAVADVVVTVQASDAVIRVPASDAVIQVPADTQVDP